MDYRFKEPSILLSRKIDPSEWLPYFKQALVVGLELELDWKRGFLPNDKLKRIFGVWPTGYHENPPCPVCASCSCYTHIPPNLIRAIQSDSSIDGKEFLIYGNALSANEFASLLPLAKLKRHFKVTGRDSCHIHALIPNQVRPVPVIILQNLWQLFRLYYPAVAWLSGNTPRSIIRCTEYSRWQDFALSGNDDSIFRAERRGGLYLGYCHPVEAGYVRNFNVEIRTPDATLIPEQLVLLRALGRALILRAVELSEFGVLQVDSDRNLWHKVKLAKFEIGNFAALERLKQQGLLEFVRDHCKRLFIELAPFLEPLERRCFNSLVQHPAWKRGRRQALEQDPPAGSETVEAKLLRILKLRTITAEKPGQWKKVVAEKLNTTPAFIAKLLNKFGADWDPDIGTYVLRR